MELRPKTFKELKTNRHYRKLIVILQVVIKLYKEMGNNNHLQKGSKLNKRVIIKLNIKMAIKSLIPNKDIGRNANITIITINTPRARRTP